MRDKIVSTDITRPVHLSNRDFCQNPYDTLATIREACPAAVIEANGFRMWIVSRYADARQLLRDPSLMKDVVTHRKQLAIQCVVRPEIRARVPHASRRSVLDRDGADHRRLRALLRDTFSHAMVSKHRPAVERLAVDLLQALPQSEPIDLVTTYARPLCMNFIAEIYGVPVDEANEFPNWENALLTGRSIAEIEEGGRRCYEFALRMIEMKRRAPAEDVFSKLLRAHEEEGQLNADELASTYIVLMIGAGETANAISSGLMLLLSDRRHLSAIKADPEAVSKYTDEILRYESPFRLLPPRFSEEPVYVDGVAIPKGEMITVCPAAANRDPSHFPHPDRFEPTDVSKDHLAFGLGEHKCLGSQLARMEMDVALRAFANYGDDLVLSSSPREAKWRAGDFMRRLDTLVVTRRPKSSG